MATKRSEYGESSIKVLKGLEPVKQRPGMYTLTDNPLHIIQEVIDNSSDEVLAGGASRIEVTLHADGSVTVTDDGRGIPVGIHKEEGVPAVQLVFTQLHAGGKFEKDSGGAYSFAGGLHGVGVSVTNALSKRLEVTVWREGKEHRIVFADGDVIEPLTSQKSPRPKSSTGTCVHVWPDPKYFDSPNIPVEQLVRLLRSKAVLMPGEQAVASSGALDVREVDVSEYISWKDGLFVFRQMPLEQIMEQVYRWYGVKAAFFDESARTETFTGVIDRSMSAEAFFDVIEKVLDVQFKMGEGNQVAITAR